MVWFWDTSKENHLWLTPSSEYLSQLNQGDEWPVSYFSASHGQISEWFPFSAQGTWHQDQIYRRSCQKTEYFRRNGSCFRAEGSWESESFIESLGNSEGSVFIVQFITYCYREDTQY